MNGIVDKEAKAVTELQQWEVETGRRLPYHPEVIAMAEQGGVVFELGFGTIERMDDDEVQTLDDHTWLAGLEQACGGNVVVTWAMTPEAYFAAVERGEL